MATPGGKFSNNIPYCLLLSDTQASQKNSHNVSQTFPEQINHKFSTFWEIADLLICE